MAVALGLSVSSNVAAAPVEAACRADRGRPDAVQALLPALRAFRSLLAPAQLALLEQPFARAGLIRWSNLPVGIVARGGLRLGDLDAAQSAAARQVFASALSSCGLTLLDEIRVADDFLIPLDTRKIGWNGGNYYLTVLGKPSSRTPWTLQIGGHHLAYNLTFNGRQTGATPLFFGSEPIRFTHAGAEHEPLAAQSTAMADLAAALAPHSGAKLSGTFTDVVKGVVVSPVPGQPPVGGTDTGFPHSYPAGGVDRGIRYDALPASAQARVRQALESYASLPGAAMSRALLAAYEAPAALAETYVGYAGAVDLSAKGAYVRIDGPRVWMEFVVQPAVADREALHYHALWRDKQADYGGEAGQ